VEQDGQRGGLGEDADVGGDGEAGEIERVEERGIDRDREKSDDRARYGGGACVAGGVEGSSVDALHGPDGESDGEDDEEVCGGCGVGAVEAATAEEVHEPGSESDHPGRDDHADGEEAGDGAADGGGEVVEPVLLEE